MSNFDNLGESVEAAEARHDPSGQEGSVGAGSAGILGALWGNANLWRVATLATIVAVALLFTTTRGPIAEYENSDPYFNGFVPPRDFEGIVNRLDQAVVTIYCDVSYDQGSQGTAFAIDLEGYAESGKTALLTNHHVIEDCIDRGKLTIENSEGEVSDVVIENYDIKNDLALLSTTSQISILGLADYAPSPGYWVMSYGSADGVEGSISIGNVLNVTTDNEILVTAALSVGNSGGPLIDNEGNVFGISTSVSTTELVQYNIVGSLDRLCDVILECDGKDFWDWG
jgi:S1-C subfamily serine protease